MKGWAKGVTSAWPKGQQHWARNSLLLGDLWGERGAPETQGLVTGAQPGPRRAPPSPPAPLLTGEGTYLLGRGRRRGLAAAVGQAAQDVALRHLQAHCHGGDAGNRGRQTSHICLHVTQKLLQLLQNYERKGHLFGRGRDTPAKYLSHPCSTHRITFVQHGIGWFIPSH